MSAKKKKTKHIKRIRKKAKSKPKRKDFSFFLAFLFLLISVCVSVYFRIQVLEAPLDRDEGTYLYLGKILLQGQIPYVDFYEIKPPGIFYTYALFHLLFGFSLKGLHIGLILINLLTAFIVYLTTVQFSTNRITALLASGLFLLLSINVWTFGFGIMSEHFVVLFATLGLYLLLKASTLENPWLFFLSGAALSWSFLIKQHGAFFILAAGIPVAAYFFLHRKKMLKPFMFWAIGGLTPALLCIIILWFQGALDEMFYWIFERTSKRYVQSISWDRGQDFLSQMLINITHKQLFYWLLAPIGLIAYSIYKKAHWKVLFLWIFCLLSFLTVFPGFRFYGHYWILMLPAVAISGALFYHATINLVPSKWKGLTSYVLLILYIVGISFSSAGIWDVYTKRNADQISQYIFGDNPFAQVKRLSEYLKPQLYSTDQIYVLGSEPQVYYYLDKNCEIRHNYVGHSSKISENSAELQQEIIDYLSNDPPEYLIHVQHYFSWGLQEGADHSLYRFAHQMINNQYDPIAYADILDRYNTRYVYNQQAVNYTPQSNLYVVLLKRR